MRAKCIVVNAHVTDGLKWSLPRGAWIDCRKPAVWVRKAQTAFLVTEKSKGKKKEA